MKNWEGGYQVVRWRVMLDVAAAKEAKEKGLDPKGNSSPIPMMYKPKLDAVFDGRCTQTIRKGDKYAVGQVRWIYEWSGRPHRSRWGRRMLVEIIVVHDCIVGDEGLQFPGDHGEYSMMRWLPWSGHTLDKLSGHDHIDPPTGLELRDVLRGLNKQARKTKGADDAQ